MQCINCRSDLRLITQLFFEHSFLKISRQMTVEVNIHNQFFFTCFWRTCSISLSLYLLFIKGLERCWGSFRKSIENKENGEKNITEKGPDIKCVILKQRKKEIKFMSDPFYFKHIQETYSIPLYFYRVYSAPKPKYSESPC